MNSQMKRFDNLNSRLESANKNGTKLRNSSEQNLDNLPVLRDYNAIINNSLTSFVATSRKIGGELSFMIDHVIRLFSAQHDFLQYAIQTKKPANDQQIAELIKPQSNEIESIIGKENILNCID